MMMHRHHHAVDVEDNEKEVHGNQANAEHINNPIAIVINRVNNNHVMVANAGRNVENNAGRNMKTNTGRNDGRGTTTRDEP